MQDAIPPGSWATGLALHEAARRACANLALLSSVARRLGEPLPVQVDEATVALAAWLTERHVPLSAHLLRIDPRDPEGP